MTRNTTFWPIRFQLKPVELIQAGHRPTDKFIDQVPIGYRTVLLKPDRRWIGTLWLAMPTNCDESCRREPKPVIFLTVSIPVAKQMPCAGKITVLFTVFTPITSPLDFNGSPPEFPVFAYGNAEPWPDARAESADGASFEKTKSGSTAERLPKSERDNTTTFRNNGEGQGT